MTLEKFKQQIDDLEEKRRIVKQAYLVDQLTKDLCNKIEEDRIYVKS